MSRSRLATALLLLTLASAPAQAMLSDNEITFEFKGLSGNTGGISTLGGRYRREWFEGSIIRLVGTWTLMAAARKDLGVDRTIVPHMTFGFTLSPSLAIVPGVGMEILSPRVNFIANNARIGVRMESYALVSLSRGLPIGKIIGLGLVCHY